MRTLLITTFIAAATAGSAFAADLPAQVSSRTDAVAEAAQAQSREVTSSDAKKIAREYLQANNRPMTKVGNVTKQGDAYKVEIQTIQGVPAGSLQVDAKTGEVKPRG
jgi:hypothetical protein